MDSNFKKFNKDNMPGVLQKFKDRIGAGLKKNNADEESKRCEDFYIEELQKKGVSVQRKSTKNQIQFSNSNFIVPNISIQMCVSKVNEIFLLNPDKIDKSIDDIYNNFLTNLNKIDETKQIIKNYVFNAKAENMKFTNQLMKSESDDVRQNATPNNDSYMKSDVTSNVWAEGIINQCSEKQIDGNLGHSLIKYKSNNFKLNDSVNVYIKESCNKPVNLMEILLSEKLKLMNFHDQLMIEMNFNDNCIKDVNDSVISDDKINLPRNSTKDLVSTYDYNILSSMGFKNDVFITNNKNQNVLTQEDDSKEQQSNNASITNMLNISDTEKNTNAIPLAMNVTVATAKEESFHNSESNANFNEFKTSLNCDPLKNKKSILKYQCIDDRNEGKDKVNDSLFHDNRFHLHKNCAVFSESHCNKNISNLSKDFMYKKDQNSYGKDATKLFNFKVVLYRNPILEKIISSQSQKILNAPLNEEIQRSKTSGDEDEEENESFGDIISTAEDLEGSFSSTQKNISHVSFDSSNELEQLQEKTVKASEDMDLNATLNSTVEELELLLFETGVNNVDMKLHSEEYNEFFLDDANGSSLEINQDLEELENVVVDDIPSSESETGQLEEPLFEGFENASTEKLTKLKDAVMKIIAESPLLETLYKPFFQTLNHISDVKDHSKATDISLKSHSDVNENTEDDDETSSNINRVKDFTSVLHNEELLLPDSSHKPTSPLEVVNSVLSIDKPVPHNSLEKYNFRKSRHRNVKELINGKGIENINIINEQRKRSLSEESSSSTKKKLAISSQDNNEVAFQKKLQANEKCSVKKSRRKSRFNCKSDNIKDENLHVRILRKRFKVQDENLYRRSLRNRLKNVVESSIKEQQCLNAESQQIALNSLSNDAGINTDEKGSPTKEVLSLQNETQPVRNSRKRKFEYLSEENSSLPPRKDGNEESVAVDENFKKKLKESPYAEGLHDLDKEIDVNSVNRLIDDTFTKDNQSLSSRIKENTRKKDYDYPQVIKRKDGNELNYGPYSHFKKLVSIEEKEKENMLNDYFYAKTFKDDLYKCCFCQFSTLARMEVYEHLNSHKIDSVFQCVHCSFTSKDRSVFIKHCVVVHKNFFSCDECGHKANTFDDIWVHKYVHSGSNPFWCNLCKYSCKLEPEIKNHILKHENNKSNSFSNASGLLTCPFCSEKFNDASILDDHIKIHFDNDVLQCPFCSFQSCSFLNVRDHILAHKEASNQEFQCQYCSITIKGALDIIYHLKSHIGMFPCYVCLNLFKENASLKEHKCISRKHMNLSNVDRTVSKISPCQFYGKRSSFSEREPNSSNGKRTNLKSGLKIQAATKKDDRQALLVNSVDKFTNVSKSLSTQMRYKSNGNKKKSFNISSFLKSEVTERGLRIYNSNKLHIDKNDGKISNTISHCNESQISEDTKHEECSSSSYSHKLHIDKNVEKLSNTISHCNESQTSEDTKHEECSSSSYSKLYIDKNVEKLSNTILHCNESQTSEYAKHEKCSSSNSQINHFENKKLSKFKTVDNTVANNADKAYRNINLKICDGTIMRIDDCQKIPFNQRSFTNVNEFFCNKEQPNNRSEVQIKDYISEKFMPKDKIAITQSDIEAEAKRSNNCKTQNEQNEKENNCSMNFVCKDDKSAIIEDSSQLTKELDTNKNKISIKEERKDCVTKHFIPKDENVYFAQNEHDAESIKSVCKAQNAQNEEKYEQEKNIYYSDSCKKDTSAINEDGSQNIGELYTSKNYTIKKEISNDSTETMLNEDITAEGIVLKSTNEEFSKDFRNCPEHESKNIIEIDLTCEDDEIIELRRDKYRQDFNNKLVNRQENIVDKICIKPLNIINSGESNNRNEDRLAPNICEKKLKTSLNHECGKMCKEGKCFNEERLDKNKDNILHGIANLNQKSSEAKIRLVESSDINDIIKTKIISKHKIFKICDGQIVDSNLHKCNKVASCPISSVDTENFCEDRYMLKKKIVAYNKSISFITFKIFDIKVLSYIHGCTTEDIRTVRKSDEVNDSDKHASKEENFVISSECINDWKNYSSCVKSDQNISKNSKENESFMENTSSKNSKEQKSLIDVSSENSKEHEKSLKKSKEQDQYSKKRKYSLIKDNSKDSMEHEKSIIKDSSSQNFKELKFLKVESPSENYKVQYKKIEDVSPMNDKKQGKSLIDDSSSKDSKEQNRINDLSNNSEKQKKSEDSSNNSEKQKKLEDSSNNSKKRKRSEDSSNNSKKQKKSEDSSNNSKKQKKSEDSSNNSVKRKRSEDSSNNSKKQKKSEDSSNNSEKQEKSLLESLVENENSRTEINNSVVCNKNIETNVMIIHNPENENEETRKEYSYACKYCAFGADKLFKLNIHLMEHSDLNPFECLFCPTTFSHPKLLKLHMKNH